MLRRLLHKVRQFIIYGRFGTSQYENDFIEFWEILEFKLKRMKDELEFVNLSDEEKDRMHNIINSCLSYIQNIKYSDIMWQNPLDDNSYNKSVKEFLDYFAKNHMYLWW